MQHSFKVGNTTTQLRKQHNFFRTTQTSFIAKFKPTSNRLGRKRNPLRCSKSIMRSVIYYNTDNRLKQLLSIKFETCPHNNDKDGTVDLYPTCLGSKYLAGKLITKLIINTIKQIQNLKSESQTKRRQKMKIDKE